MVDAVRNAEPRYQGLEADAAGHDQDQGAVAEILQDAAQPAQKLVDLGGACESLLSSRLRKIGSSSITRSTGLS